MFAPAVLATAGNNVLQQWKISLSTCSLSEIWKRFLLWTLQELLFFSIHRTFMVIQGCKEELNFRWSQGSCLPFLNLVDLFFPRLLYMDFFNKHWDKLRFGIDFTLPMQFGQLCMSLTKKCRCKEGKANSQHQSRI